ncbi:Tyrosine-protein phosphatase yvh1 Short=PTPase yvh1 [Rhizoctonia solani AG-1 IB]|uniref:protein-tyrosine-phosphatase n=1 Tax=Thanatephorus cucumeris (strain AG1-IB / isolate 7/3/14) TaxID=1108050 RepID=M5BKL7_THACB|nr:Tyrosine-protein phosphatase yvh1 Short=PTPase yvh1 [Rhizoctonia solani AG-1 IB]
MSMDEVTENLWVGDFGAATSIELLEMAGVKYVTMQRHQIPLDDTEEQDVLSYLPATIAFIQKSLASGDGVLIHCMAGMSRSATIAAAYLMYTKGLDPTGALELIREVRPTIQPNPSFLHQLDVFHAAYCKISKRDKNIREYYLERTANEMINGDGSAPDMSMIASYPRTPTASAPATPGGPRRRIRCKMCRRELATREHMMDHSQGGPTTPVSVNGSATVSRRQSFSDSSGNVANGLQLTSMSPAGSRRPSTIKPRRRSSLNQSMRPGGVLGGGLTPLTTMQPTDKADKSDKIEKDDANGYISHPDRRPSIIASEAIKKLSTLAMTAVDSDGPDDYAVDDEEEDEETPSATNTSAAPSPIVVSGPLVGNGRVQALRANSLNGVAARRGKPHRISLPSGSRKELELPRTPADEVTPGLDATRAIDPSIAQAVAAQENVMELDEEASAPTSPQYQHPSEMYSGLPPKLAALRRPSVVQAFKASGLTGMTPISQSPALSPPILYNPKCSGYFVEPLKWMKPFLDNGQLAGKIICPNPKCGAKLGNYDWAGGFCIHRSKVDEIW